MFTLNYKVRFKFTASNYKKDYLFGLGILLNMIWLDLANMFQK